MKKLLILIFAACFVLPLTGMLGGCTDPNMRIYAGSDMTIIEALEKVTEGGTVVLEKDVTVSEVVVINKVVTIDLGGFTINNETNIWNDPADNSVNDWSLISVQEGGELTIKNGSLIAKSGDCYAIDVKDGAKCTIESGNYVGNISAVYVFNGELNIKGGTFSIQQLSELNDYRYTLNSQDSNWAQGKAKITVYGGSFKNFDPSANLSGEGNLVADGYKVEQQSQNGDIFYSVVRQ